MPGSVKINALASVLLLIFSLTSCATASQPHSLAPTQLSVQSISESPVVESQPMSVLRRWQGQSTTCQSGTYVLRTTDEVSSLLGKKDVLGLQTGEVAIVVCGSNIIRTEAVYEQKERGLVVLEKTVELASCPSIPSYELKREFPAKGQRSAGAG